MLQAYQAIWDYRDKPHSLANQLNIWNTRIAESQKQQKIWDAGANSEKIMALLRHFLQDSTKVYLGCAMSALLMFAEQTAVTLTELP